MNSLPRTDDPAHLRARLTTRRCADTHKLRPPGCDLVVHCVTTNNGYVRTGSPLFSSRGSVSLAPSESCGKSYHTGSRVLIYT